MFFINGFGDEADAYCDDAHQDKEDDAEVQIVDILDDGGPGVLTFPTCGHRVAELPDEADHPHQQASHQAPESSL